VTYEAVRLFAITDIWSLYKAGSFLDKPVN